MNFLLSTALVICWSSGFIGAKLGAGSASAVTILMWRFLPLAVIATVAVAQAVVVGDTVRDGAVHTGAEGGEQDMSAWP